MNKPVIILLLLFTIGCSSHLKLNLKDVLIQEESIKGKAEYLDSPFFTAGDKLYMVGHQKGTFPDLGWHVKGEMGGIWCHPIKLMDGFNASIELDDEILKLDQAKSFTNYPYGNSHSFNFEKNDLSVERYQFVPDQSKSILVEFQIKNQSRISKTLSFHIDAKSDLRPTWLGDETGMIDSPDMAKWDQERWIIKDSLNPWYAIIGGDGFKKTSKVNNTFVSIGSGESVSLHKEIELNANEEITIQLIISGSERSEEEALEQYQNLKTNFPILIASKAARYKSLGEKTKLTIPDKKLEQAFRWLKYNTDWLIRDVDNVGRGISAGVPDYPWWFGVDSEYALQGVIMLGQKELVFETISLIDSLSSKLNGNGRIIHEVSTNGYVFNPGNINETPQFISLIWRVYEWTGDKEFLKKYFHKAIQGIEWLYSNNDKDHNLLPDGFGMMEIHGLNSEMIDVASYTYKALLDLSKMANVLGKSEESELYLLKAEKLKIVINDEFWNKKFQSYSDFVGTQTQALQTIKNAIERAKELNKPWAVEELENTYQKLLEDPEKSKKGYVVHHNWVVNTPMEVGLAPKENAIMALNTARKYTNPFGLFVTGIDRDESAGNDISSAAAKKKTFDYIGAVMTLPTGVQAIAENNYHRPNEALDYLKRMTNSFSYALPGSIYEVSPDFGMVTQAWNAYSFAVPIVSQFFGIQPDAGNKTITITPQMPNEWNEASLENVEIGGNTLSIICKKKGAESSIEITQKEDWKITVINNSKIVSSSNDSKINVRF